MRTIMAAKTPHDSFSFSRRYFWKKKIDDDDDEDDDHEVLNFSSTYWHFSKEDDDKEETLASSDHTASAIPPRKKHSSSLVSFSKLRSALSGNTSRSSGTLTGTLFGYRRGHAYLAFQKDPKLNPTFLIELATPTSVLVREMASGVVRIALECEKNKKKTSITSGNGNDENNNKKTKKKGVKLVEEKLRRTYCNGKKCGFTTRRECGEEEWKVMKALEPVSMGAGVLPGGDKGCDGVGSEGELMYMRAKFERVVGSKESEAFYMVSPEGSGGPELSVFLLRV